MPEKSIAITFKPVYLKNNYLYISVKQTAFFPPGEPRTMRPVTVETGPISFASQLQYNSKAYI
ncbi:MAG: hypothetical protein LUQ69_09870 [Methanoregulaceae archaeon]|nr:hypothetical protein [Methanoregulaceae archaeon]